MNQIANRSKLKKQDILKQIAKVLDFKARQGVTTFALKVNILHGGCTSIDINPEKYGEHYTASDLNRG